MPQINVQGQPPRGPKGPKGPSNSLADIFQELTKTLKPELEKQFEQLWKSALPTPQMLTGMWRNSVLPEIGRQIGKAAQMSRAGNGFADRGGMEGMLRIFSKFGGTLPADMANMANVARQARSSRLSLPAPTWLRQIGVPVGDSYGPSPNAVPVGRSSFGGMSVRGNTGLLASIARNTGMTAAATKREADDIEHLTQRNNTNTNGPRLRIGGFSYKSGFINRDLVSLGGFGGGSIGPPGPPGGGGGGSGFYGPYAPVGPYRGRGIRFLNHARSGGSGGGLGLGGTIAAAYAAAMFAPKVLGAFGSLNHAWTDPAAAYMTLSQQTSAAGLAGGFDPGGLRSSLGGTPAMGHTPVTPAWMKALGITPSDVNASMSAYGIAPRSTSSYLGIASSLATNALSPGFAGMAPGTVEGIARQGVGYGAATNSAGGVQTYLSTFSGIMEQSIAKGADRSKVLNNVQSAVDVVAKSGAVGIDIPGIMDTFSRLMSTGTPGGLSGRSAADLISGYSGALDQVGTGGPLQTMAMAQAVAKNGGIGDMPHLQKMLGMNDTDFATQMKNPVFSKMASNATSLSQNPGLMPFALQYLAELMQANPSSFSGPLSSFSQDFGINNQAMGPIGIRGLTGNKLSDIIGSQVGVPGALTGPRSKEFNQQMQDFMSGNGPAPNGVFADVHAALANLAQVDLKDATAAFTVFTKSMNSTAETMDELNNAIANLLDTLDKHGMAYQFGGKGGSGLLPYVHP